MNGMMTELKKPERVKTEAIMTLVLLVFSIGGCSLEDVDMQTIDTNHSDDSALPSLAEPIPMSSIDQIRSSVPLNRTQLDSLMEENLKEFGAEFSKTLPQPDKVDYERLKFLFQQSLLDREPKSPENKFQFLCESRLRGFYPRYSLQNR